MGTCKTDAVHLQLLSTTKESFAVNAGSGACRRGQLGTVSGRLSGHNREQRHAG